MIGYKRKKKKNSHHSMRFGSYRDNNIIILKIWQKKQLLPIIEHLTYFLYNAFEQTCRLMK